MAEGPIRHEEVIEKDLFKNPSESADIFLEKINLIIAGIKNLMQITGKKIPLTDPKTLTEAEQLSAALKKITELENGLTQAQKIQIEAQVIRANQVKAEKDAIKGVISAYQALQNEYTKAAQKAKDLAASQGLGSKAAKQAAIEANNLNNRLKAIDSSIGNHQRNVGNYKQTVIGASKAFSGMSGVLDILGRSLGVNEEVLQTLKQSHTTLRELSRDLTHVKLEELGVHEANTVAMEEETVAAEALAVAETGGIGVFAAVGAAIAAVTAAIAIYILNKEASIKIEEESQKAVDGTVIKNKEERDSYNELTIAIAASGGAIEEAAQKHKVALANIRSETFEKLKDATTGWNSFLSVFGGGFKSAQEVIDALEENASKKRTLANKEETERIKDRNKQREEATKKLIEKEKKEEEDALEAKKKADEKAIEDRQKDLEKEFDAFVKYWDKVDSENAKRLAEGEKFWDESMKEIEKINEDALKQRREDEKNELEAKQKDLDKEFDAFVKYWDKVDKENSEKLKQKHEKEVEAAAKLSEEIFKDLQGRADAEKKINAEKLSELDKQISFQQQLALQGEKNNLGELQRERAKALEEKRRIEQREAKAKEAEQLADIFLEFMKVYAKDGISAAGKAAVATIAAKGGAKLIAGFFKDGVENFQGKGTETSDSNLIGFSKGESVVTAKGTKETPGLASAVNERGFQGATEWAIENVFPKIGILQDKSISGQVNEKILSQAVNEIKGLRKDVQDMGSLEFEENALGEIVALKYKMGIMEKTTFKKTPGSYSKH